MSGRWAKRAALVAIALATAACDNFSFFGELDKLAGLGPLRIFPGTAVAYTGGLLTFTVEGGKPPYAFGVLSGGGTITATSSTTAQYTAPGADALATVRVTDSAATTSDARVNVIAPPDALGIHPSVITLQAGSSYVFSGTGGAPPYTYSIFSGSGTINASSGAFTAPATAQTVKVRVTDSAGSTPADATVSVVDTGPLLLSPVSPVIVQQGNSEQFAASGGSQPYTYTISAGTGASVDVSGVFTTLATTPAGSALTVKVTDNVGGTATSNVTIAPATPGNLAADGTYGLPTEILLTWTDSSVGETGFEIEMKTGGGLFTVLGSQPLPAGTTSFVVGTLSPNTAYTFRIRAVFDPTTGSPRSGDEIYSAYSALAFDISNR